MHHVRQGKGRPLLLVHGLGGSHGSWETITSKLAGEREVIAVDLPGFGATPPLPGSPSIAAMADVLEGFLDEQGLDGVDVVGSSMGARLALELARRGLVGATVALDPGGFWTSREQRVFGLSIKVSVRLVRALSPLLPLLTGNPVTRTLLLSQFTAAPWRLDGDVALRELRRFLASPSFDGALHELAHGPLQGGMPAGTARGPIVIGWGRRDLVTLPRQAPRAARLFPDAELVWFERSGHFPHWDAADETVQTILAATRTPTSTIAAPVPAPG
ncbi:MAG TPA: alpha/beta fold hydrolase [Microbacterium sp.]|nr:alpha/beta fold hydrolase [Microbacterium sp.]